MISYKKLDTTFQIICSLYITAEVFSEQNDVTQINHSSTGEKDDSEKKAQNLFKIVFMETRLQQIDAIQSVLKFQNYEKQYKITSKALEKMFEILASSKTVVESSDYIPGLDLPKNSSVSEALGQVIDNTAMYGEFQLKLPDVTDDIMKNHPDWLVLIKWAIGFSNSTGLFDEKTTHMVNLLCQEMNLIERNKNFMNPYRKYDIKVREQSSALPKEKKKVKIKRGPRMSKPRHTEF